MKVIVTARGYRENRVWEPGQTFDVEEGVTASWFTPVEKAAPAPVVESAPEPVTLSEIHSRAHPDAREQKTPRKKK